MTRFLFTNAALFLFLARATATNAVTLEALLQRTIEKNPEILKARAQLEQAAGRRLVFRAVALPDATIGSPIGVQGGHRSGEKPVQPFAFARGNLIQPLFNAAVPASQRRGDLEILIAQQQLNVAVADQLHAARIAFYTALQNRSLKDLGEEQRQRLEENMNSEKARYEAGLTDRSAVVGSQVQTRELDPRIAAAQRAYEGAVLEMAMAMGEDLDARANLPKPEGELIYRTVQLDPNRETAPALQRRTDLKLARLLVRAADEDQRIIAAGYYPLINAVVAGEYIPVSGVRRENVASPRRSDNVISSEVREGAAYTWRVIDNGKVGGAVFKQKSARQINERELQKLEGSVPRELARISNDLAAIASKQKALLAASAAAEQNAVTLQQNLAGGVGTQLEFRLGENDLLEIKSGLTTLAYQQSVALAEWDRATGRYLQFSDEATQNVQ